MLAMEKLLRPITIAVVLCTLLCIAISADSEEQFHPDKARFFCDSSIVYFPHGKVGLIFDTAECINCRQSLPEWRFIGDLKVDSIIYIDSTLPLTEENQIADIEINSPGLRRILENSNAYKIAKSFPEAVPEDTLFWDSVRVKWHILPDISKYYTIRFDEAVEMDSVINWLRSVPDIRKIEKIWIPPEPE